MDKLKNETLQFIWKEHYTLVSREIVRYKKVSHYFNKPGKLLDVGCRGENLRNS